MINLTVEVNIDLVIRVFSVMVPGFTHFLYSLYQLYTVNVLCLVTLSRILLEEQKSGSVSQIEVQSRPGSCHCQ